jgi:DNA-binding NarL/FixJ family response regulator
VTSVLVVDDEDLLREGLRMMLEAEADLEVVGEAATGAQAVQQARELDPDVVLMDIRMPELDGIEATRRLTRAHPRSRVLVLTTFDLDEYVYRALKAGASGFLLKDARREQLVGAVRAVAHGDTPLSPAVLRRLVADFCDRPDPGVPAEPDVLQRLSERERDVLHQLARGASNTEIAQALFLAETTVKTHVARILSKLDVRDRVHVVVWAYESGFVRPA